MTRLRGNPDFVEFLEVVQEYERDLAERLAGANETVVIYRSQGGITALRQIREVYASAPDMIRKLEGK